MRDSRLRIVVTGLLAQYRLGAVTWEDLRHPLGLARMGHDVYYFEDSGQWPYDPVEGGLAKKPDRNVRYSTDAIVDPNQMCADPVHYRGYIQSSKAEWSAAKQACCFDSAAVLERLIGEASGDAA
jgi:hypothetical protein